MCSFNSLITHFVNAHTSELAIHIPGLSPIDIIETFRYGDAVPFMFFCATFEGIVG